VKVFDKVRESKI